MRNVNITRRLFESLPRSPASGTKKLAWDASIKGFGVYRTSRGIVSFVFQYTSAEGRTRSRHLGNHGELTLEQARDLASDLAHQRRRGLDPVEEMLQRVREERARTELVLSTYAEGYLLRRIEEGRPLNAAQTKIVRRDVCGSLGHMRMDRITVDDVERFAAEMAGRGPSARRMGLTYLKVVLNDAVRRGKIPRSAAEAVVTNKSGERSRRLRDDELLRLLEAARDLGDARGDIVEMLVRTAKRKEEVSRMRWEELNMARGLWTLPPSRTKNSQPYLIELPPGARAIVERQQPDPRLRRGFVFTLDGSTAPEMGSQVKDLLDAHLHRRLEAANGRDGTSLGVEHFTLHDIRTAIASGMEEEPFLATSKVIDAVLLHKKEGRVTRTYQRARLEVEADMLLRRWDAHVDALLSSPGAWPGGAAPLPPMKGDERRRRLKELRAGWPLRTDQKKAREREDGQERRRRRRGRKEG